jgi:hypothetical protein
MPSYKVTLVRTTLEFYELELFGLNELEVEDAAQRVVEAEPEPHELERYVQHYAVMRTQQVTQ